MHAGDACTPREDPAPGQCRWITTRQYQDMELYDHSLCFGKAEVDQECLHCVSAVFEGDDETVMARSKALIAEGRIWQAYRPLNYLSVKSKRCPAKIGPLWEALGKASEAAKQGASGFYYRRATECDPTLYSAYVEWAAAESREPLAGFPRVVTLGAIFELSRALANFDAPPRTWDLLIGVLEQDPRLESVRQDRDFATVRERFSWGRSAAAATPRAPFFMCKADETPLALGAPRRKSDCRVPVIETTCPSSYLKVRVAAIPSSLPPCAAR